MDVVYKVKGKEFKGKKEAAAFERIYDAVELLVWHDLSPVEGHITLCTSRKNIHSLLICDLGSQTSLAEEVKAR